MRGSSRSLRSLDSRYRSERRRDVYSYDTIYHVGVLGRFAPSILVIARRGVLGRFAPSILLHIRQPRPNCDERSKMLRGLCCRRKKRRWRRPQQRHLRKSRGRLSISRRCASSARGFALHCTSPASVAVALHHVNLVNRRFHFLRRLVLQDAQHGAPVVLAN